MSAVRSARAAAQNACGKVPLGEPERSSQKGGAKAWQRQAVGSSQVQAHMDHWATRAVEQPWAGRRDATPNTSKGAFLSLSRPLGQWPNIFIRTSAVRVQAPADGPVVEPKSGLEQRLCVQGPAEHS